MTDMTWTGLLPEWAPQWGVMLTWPHENTDWNDWLDDIERVYGELVREISAREQVLIVAQSADHERHIREVISQYQGNIDRVKFAQAASNDTWARDHGPLTVRDEDGLTLKNFVFNGWGNKWVADLDNAINQTLSRAGTFAVPMDDVHFVLEGGGVEVNGAGTLLTTRQCLLSPERNPRYNEAEIEAKLKKHLGLQRIQWLDHGHLEGDDTDSHIDTLARFANRDSIVYQACDDVSDPHYEDLAAMRAELEALRTVLDKPYTLHALPWPKAQHDPVTGQRLPASYANFLIINGAVLAPAYADPADAKAEAVLAEAFPDREIVMIDCRPVIRGFGSLHCITMQLPIGTIA